MADIIGSTRLLAGLGLAKLAGRLVGNRPTPEAEQLRHLRAALGEITATDA